MASSNSPADRIRQTWAGVRPILAQRALWIGVLAVVAFWAGLFLLVDRWVMPAYTRHGVQVSVPDVRALSLEEAEDRIRAEGFDLGQTVFRYDPEQPQDVILHQEPAPNTRVKPGRRIYLTINSGDAPLIPVPDLQFVSMREAKTRLASNRLMLGEVLEDTLPAPFKNTVTRQQPAPGDSVLPGTTVTIWVSSGLGETLVEVPEITGLAVPTAERILATAQLRLVVLEDPSIPLARMDTIARQLPQPGAQVRAGSEIRGFAHMSEAPIELMTRDSLAAPGDVPN